MLLWLYTHVLSVSSVSEHMLQVFYLNVAYVANSYVASVCSECFIYLAVCCNLFHLSVAKVDLDVCVEEA